MWNLLSSDYMPHQHCFLMKQYLVTAHIATNLLICLAYYTFPLIVLCRLRQFRELGAVVWISIALFVFFCGTGHLLTALTITMWPAYDFLAVWHVCTALISWVSMVLFWKTIPQIQKVISNTLQFDIVEAKLRRIEELETRMKDGAKMDSSVWDKR